MAARWQQPRWATKKQRGRKKTTSKLARKKTERVNARLSSKAMTILREQSKKRTDESGFLESYGRIISEALIAHFKRK